MKRILVLVFFVMATGVSAQTEKSKTALVNSLKKSMTFPNPSEAYMPEGMANTIEDIKVRGSSMEVKLVYSYKDILGTNLKHSNCYSFDLLKIEYAVGSNLDFILLKAVNNDTSIFKIQKCKSIDSKKETDKLPLTVFYENYFVLPAKDQEKTAELFNELLAICINEEKKN